MVDQIIQVLGSLLILSAFFLLQMRRLAPDSRKYLLINLLGSIVLAINAATSQQWGFLLLQVVWAIVSLVSFIHVTVTRKKSLL